MDEADVLDDNTLGQDTDEYDDDGEESVAVEPPQKRINIFNAGAMTVTALLIDIIQALVHLLDIGVITAVIAVAANFVIEITAWVLFYLWFRLSGVSFIGPRQLLTFIGMGAGEIVTAGLFPAWTIGVLMLIAFTNAEAKIKKYTGVDIDIAKAAHGKIR